MPEEVEGRDRHFILEGVTDTEAYRYPGTGGGGRPRIPTQNRAEHGARLSGQISELRVEADAASEAQRDAGMEEGLGIRIEFESFPDVKLAFESLARERSGIELLNVRDDGERIQATVFVPDGRLDHFEGLIRDYLAKKRDRADRPRDNQPLIDAIREIRAASVRALWTDTEEAFPSLDENPFWWEVWLPVRRNREATTAAFRERAEAQGIEVARGELMFPERTVLVARASLEQMQRSMVTLNSIAELRRGKETAEFFDSSARDEQAEWLADLLRRTRFAPTSYGTPYVCLLDTGINRGHPLLAPALATADLHTVEPGWGIDDAHGHGTEMAGVALAGDLAGPLADNHPVEIDHRLESVKLVPRDGATGSDPRHHGYLTVEAVARPEVNCTLPPPRLRDGGDGEGQSGSRSPVRLVGSG